MQGEVSPRFPEKGFYYHYKHKPTDSYNTYAYEVVGIVRNTEDEEFYVTYRPLYETEFLGEAYACARPLSMFMGTVSKDGIEVPRFSKIIDAELISRLETIRDEKYPS